MSSILGPLLNILPLEGPWPLTSSRILEYLGGQPAASGVSVTESSALGLDAFWACVQILTQDVAKLPLGTHERLPGGGNRDATEHPTYRLLHTRPNPAMTSYQFRSTLQGHLCLRGNAYAEIERDRGGRPVALWPLHPDFMQRPYLSAAGTLVYPYTLPSGEGKELPQRLILHVRGFSLDGLTGLAPLHVHRDTIGGALARREYGDRYYGQGARPGGVLETLGKLTPESATRVSQSWTTAHTGLSNAHRIAVLEEGLHYTAIGLSPEDSQYVEQQQLGTIATARIFRMQPHKIAELSRATFSNIEQQSIEYVTDTLMPWVINWEQEYAGALLLANEEDRYYIKHNVNGLLRGDVTARTAFYTAMWDRGVFCSNDILRLEDQNPIPDEEGGNLRFRPANMVRLTQETPMTAIDAAVPA